PREHQAVAIDDARLAGRHRALRIVEAHADAPLVEPFDARGSRLVPVADLYLHRPGAQMLRRDEEVQILRFERLAQEVVRRSDHERVRLRLESGDVQRLGMSNAHLAPLSDRVVHEAGMLSLDLAIGRSYRTGLEQRVLFAQHLAQHLDVPAAIDEADVLAVFLVPDRKAESTRSLAHFSLRELTEWK